jgi:imidazolonepropionase-like amidohydrolase
VSIGSHGQQHGMGPHWEIWMEASAMGPMGEVETTTIFPARFLGMDKDIGSLEVGKLADLLVLNANPLDDIQNTKDIRDIMKAGVLYDGESLDEIWPKASPYGIHFWYDSAAFRSDKRGIDYWDHPTKH